MDVARKSVLRRLKGNGQHTDAVTCAKFGRRGSELSACILSAGRDKAVRLWDVSTGEFVSTIGQHRDYVKSLVSAADSTWISGGYDGMIHVWDVRQGTEAGGHDRLGVATGAVFSFNNTHPVESLAVFPSGLLLLSAGANEVRLWDLQTGSREPVAVFAAGHAKQIVHVDIDTEASVMMTAALDASVKLHDAKDFRHLWSFTLPNPVTCAAWCPDDEAFSCSMGPSWQLRRRPPRTQGEGVGGLGGAVVARKRVVVGSTRYQKRGKRAAPTEADRLMGEDDGTPPPGKKSGKLIDFHLRKFEYRKALEVVVLQGGEGSASPEIALSFFDELNQRGVMREVLQGHDEASCLNILHWVLRVATLGGGTPFRSTALEVLLILVESNPSLSMASSPPVLDILEKIRNKINQELVLQRQVAPLVGLLDTVLAS